MRGRGGEGAGAGRVGQVEYTPTHDVGGLGVGVGQVEYTLTHDVGGLGVGVGQVEYTLTHDVGGLGLGDWGKVNTH